MHMVGFGAAAAAVQDAETRAVGDAKKHQPMVTGVGNDQHRRGRRARISVKGEATRSFQVTWGQAAEEADAHTRGDDKNADRRQDMRGDDRGLHTRTSIMVLSQDLHHRIVVNAAQHQDAIRIAIRHGHEARHGTHGHAPRHQARVVVTGGGAPCRSNAKRVKGHHEGNAPEKMMRKKKA